MTSLYTDKPTVPKWQLYYTDESLNDGKEIKGQKVICKTKTIAVQTAEDLYVSDSDKQSVRVVKLKQGV